MINALLVLIFLACAQRAIAEAPLTLTYSGYLTNVDGAPSKDGRYRVTFRVMGAATGGTALWHESQSVSAVAGAFSAVLGAHGSPLDESVLAGEDALWLEIEVDGDVMEPRFPITSVPWAIRARSAADLECNGCVDETSVNASAVQLRVDNACAVGSAIRAINADGTVVCDADTDTNTLYSPGTGLDLNGTTFSIGPDTGSCTNGQILKYNSSTGWTCQNDIDTDTDTNTLYSAGTGVDLNGTTFNIGPDTGSCTNGQILKYNSSTGWTCQDDIDTDTNTLYSAGTGVDLNGTTFSIGPDTGSCTNGQILKYNSSTGWICQNDIDTDTNTLYSAGTGVDLNGTTFSIGPDSGSCTSGQTLKYNSSTGWTCQDDIDTDTNTLYSAGTGVDLNGTTFSVGPDSGSCTNGQVLKYSSSTGWICQNDIDTDTNTLYSAGTGIDLNGTTLSIGPDSGSCTNGQILKYNSSTGWICQNDIDTDTNTLYSAGTGVDLNGTTFSIGPDSGSCTSGQTLKYNSSTGWTCQDDIDTDTNTLYSAGTGVDLNGTTFSVGPDSGSCTNGQVLKYSSSTGWICQNDIDTDTNTLYSAGTGIDLNGTTLSIGPDSGSCTNGQVLKYNSSTGWTCQNDTDTNVSYSAGAGITLAAEIFAADTSFLQRRISASCPGGMAVQGVNGDGTVACAAISGSGGGSVTQINTGTGLTGGPISGTGTVALSSSYADGSAYDARFVNAGCAEPIYLGKTIEAYTGAVGGYASAHQECKRNFPGSMVCTGTDIMRSIACGEIGLKYMPRGQGGWYVEGVSDSLISECKGYTSDAGSSTGRYWVNGSSDVLEVARPFATTCNQFIPFLCCRL